MQLNNKNKTQVPLSQIRELGNVRHDYDPEKIEELARSIEKNGLINPVTIRLLDETDEYGNPLYELICGHRRKRAFEYLASQGSDRTQIPCVMVTGNKLNLQLIENIQRENLSPSELEQGLQEMVKEGMSQSQIAEELSKSPSWVNDALKGGQIREAVQSMGIDTTEIGTRAMATMRSIPAEKIPEAVQELKKQGGTVKAATKIRDSYRDTKGETQNFARANFDGENNHAEEKSDIEVFKELLDKIFYTVHEFSLEECKKLYDRFLLYRFEIIRFLRNQ